MEANGSTRMVDMTSAYARLEQAREASRNRNRSSPTDTVVLILARRIADLADPMEKEM